MERPTEATQPTVSQKPPLPQQESCVSDQHKGSAQDTSQSTKAPSSTTLLRVKRKRTDSPPDTLVVEVPHKKRTGVGGLLSPLSELSTKPKTDLPPPVISHREVRQVYRLACADCKQLPPNLQVVVEEKRQQLKAPPQPPAQEARLFASLANQRERAKDARYKKVRETRLNQQESEGKQPEFNVLEIEKLPLRKPGQASTAPKQPPPADASVFSCNGVPMVREYLSLKDQPASDKGSSSNNNNNNNNEDDYVFDIYVQDDNMPLDQVRAHPVIRIERFDEDLVLEHEYEDSDSARDSEDEDGDEIDYPEEPLTDNENSEASEEDGLSSDDDEGEWWEGGRRDDSYEFE